MSGYSALLLLACGSLLSSHPVFWTTSSTSSPGSPGRIRNLERSKLTGGNIAFEGNDQHKGNNEGVLVPTTVSRDVTMRSLLPKYNCHYPLFLRCPDRSSRRRRLLKEKLTKSLFAKFGQALVEQAVIQALGARYINGYKHQEDKKTSNNIITT